MECFFGTPVAPLLAVRVVSSANPEFPLAADRRDRAGHRGRPCGPGRAAGATAPARNKKNSKENRMLPGRRAERRLFADRGGAAAGDTHPGWRTAAGKRDFPESWNQNARPCGPFDLGGLFAFLKGLARRGGGLAEAVGSVAWFTLSALAEKMRDARRRRHPPPGGPVAAKAQGNGRVVVSVGKIREDGVLFARPWVMAAGLGHDPPARVG